MPLCELCDQPFQWDELYSGVCKECSDDLCDRALERAHVWVLTFLFGWWFVKRVR